MAALRLVAHGSPERSNSRMGKQVFWNLVPVDKHSTVIVQRSTAGNQRQGLPWKQAAFNVYD
jgi:hypothetical protein